MGLSEKAPRATERGCYRNITDERLSSALVAA
jgi:hypothetical protein